MLYMVVERFRPGAVGAIRERFVTRGRMMPEGLRYVSSWLEKDGPRCFQLMETEDPGLFQAWIDEWGDLMEFEVVPVETSAQFWKAWDASG
jgi:hypothetical protein